MHRLIELMASDFSRWSMNPSAHHIRFCSLLKSLDPKAVNEMMNYPIAAISSFYIGQVALARAFYV